MSFKYDIEKFKIIPDYFQKMAIEDWKDFVSTTATISTVINFMTGLQVSAKVLPTKNCSSSSERVTHNSRRNVTKSLEGLSERISEVLCNKNNDSIETVIVQHFYRTRAVVGLTWTGTPSCSCTRCATRTSWPETAPSEWRSPAGCKNKTMLPMPKVIVRI